jgi:hypothetical protein
MPGSGDHDDPGLRARLSATRDAVRRLVEAHVELARAEFAAIGGQIGRMAGLVGLAVALLIFTSLLVLVGLGLFLGEWLFGSMGWGILHGVLFLPGVAFAAIIMALGMSPEWVVRRLAVALGLGLIVAVVLGLAWPNLAYGEIGRALVIAVDEGNRPLVVGIGVGALVGVVLALLLTARYGGTAIVAGLIGGAIAGALLGAFTAISFELHVGIALGLTAAYTAWIALMAYGLYRSGLDVDALKARFYPSQTIDTTKETLEWLKRRMPPGTGS